MSKVDAEYKRMYRQILSEGVWKENRTGVKTIATTGLTFTHFMEDGFPALTTKKLFYKAVKVELEGFIKGITSKKWFQDRGCRIWNEWCNPQKVPYSTDPEVQKQMAEEDDLGPCIYGAAWRNFHDPSACYPEADSYGIDQLKNIVETLKTNPNDRRMICMAWNPAGLNHTALPPCHFCWQVVVVGDRLDLIFSMRSNDFLLGLPFNIASYATLLHLLCLETSLKPGKLTGNFGDIHIYENHLEPLKEQMSRSMFCAPKIKTNNFTSIFDWEASQTGLVDYKSHPPIKAKVAV